MHVQNPQLERTPTTLILRQTRLSQTWWLVFGGCWLALLAPAGCVLGPLVLIGSTRWLFGGLGLSEFIGPGTSGVYLFGIIVIFFVGVGLWMMWLGLQGEYLEAHVWTFDKVSGRLIIARQLRHRRTQVQRLEQVENYPLPMPGAVQTRSTMGPEHFEHELVVSIDGKTVHGLRQWAMQGDLRQVARDINDFLAA